MKHKTCREIYQEIYEQNYYVLIRFNKEFAKNEFYRDRFKRAANLIAVKTTTKKWRQQ